MPTSPDLGDRVQRFFPFLTKWSLPDTDAEWNSKTHIYKIGFSFYWSLSPAFGFKVLIWVHTKISQKFNRGHLTYLTNFSRGRDHVIVTELKYRPRTRPSVEFKNVIKRKLLRWSRIRWKKYKKFTPKLYTIGRKLLHTVVSYKSKTPFSITFSLTTFSDAFLLYIFNGKQHQILRFLLPILNSWKKKNLGSFYHFLLTLKRNADETAKKKQKTSLINVP